MIIKEIHDINVILPIHYEIFGKEFPISSYYKKSKTNMLYIFVYEEDSKLIGYSIIVDQDEKKNLYAWYGGVLPKYQGRGITQIFFDKLINFAKEKEYDSVTLATSNIRPHMLSLAIKMGFDIVDLKKRETGEGNKIYFEYKILPETTEEISLKENEKYISFVQIEEKLVSAYKNNCVLLKINCNDNLEALIYAVKYCNSFIRKPKIQINLQDSPIVSFKINEIIEGYKGEIEINN